MTYELTILCFMEHGQEYTSQEITERIFRCKKPDAIYNNHIEDVSKDMQTLCRKGFVQKEKIDTAHGYSICKWSLTEDGEAEDDRAFEQMRAAEDRALDEWQEGHDFQWREEE